MKCQTVKQLMKKENDILAELREWGSPLADMSRAMPFEVPVDYFVSRIQDEPLYAKESLKGLDTKDMPYGLPAGYFEALPQQILDIAKVESYNEHMPKQTPFSIPTGYFEGLPAQIMAQVKAKPAKKVFIFKPKIWIRQAVAAVLVVAIGIGGYEYSIHTQYSPEKQLARVPKTTVQQYLHQSVPDAEPESINAAGTYKSIEIATQQLDKKDIEQYLDETGSNIN